MNIKTVTFTFISTLVLKKAALERLFENTETYFGLLQGQLQLYPKF